MQESINPTQGETPSSNTQATILTGAALLGGAALLAATPKAAHAVTPAVRYAQIPGTGDIKPLNFALALEVIEADLYNQCIARLTALGVSSSDPLLRYVTEFAKVENEHRDFLTAAIKAANNGVTIRDTLLRGATFNFRTATSIDYLATADSILDFLIAVEDTGVQAYIGAVPKFAVRSPYLPTAAAIQGTEARHTAALTVVRNRKKGVQPDTAQRKSSTAPQFNENQGRDGIIREGAQSGANINAGERFLDTVLAGVSPFIVLPAN